MYSSWHATSSPKVLIWSRAICVQHATLPMTDTKGMPKRRQVSYLQRQRCKCLRYHLMSLAP